MLIGAKPLAKAAVPHEQVEVVEMGGCSSAATPISSGFSLSVLFGVHACSRSSPPRC